MITFHKVFLISCIVEGFLMNPYYSNKTAL